MVVQGITEKGKTMTNERGAWTQLHIGSSGNGGIQAVERSAWHDTYTGLFSEEYIEQALEQWWSSDYLRGAVEAEGGVLLVAEEEQQIIGVAESQVLDERRAILWKLYVLKAQRGKGVGSARVLKE
jgi:GNAT superfamily N-acetyltransferase